MHGRVPACRAGYARAARCPRCRTAGRRARNDRIRHAARADVRTRPCAFASACRVRLFRRARCERKPAACRLRYRARHVLDMRMRGHRRGVRLVPCDHARTDARAKTAAPAHRSTRCRARIRRAGRLPLRHLVRHRASARMGVRAGRRRRRHPYHSRRAARARVAVRAR